MSIQRFKRFRPLLMLIDVDLKGLNTLSIQP